MLISSLTVFDSGSKFGKTTAGAMILYRFDVGNNVECWAGNEDYVRGDAHCTAGLESENHKWTQVHCQNKSTGMHQRKAWNELALIV